MVLYHFYSNIEYMASVDNVKSIFSRHFPLPIQFFFRLNRGKRATGRVQNFFSLELPI